MDVRDVARVRTMVREAQLSLRGLIAEQDVPNRHPAALALLDADTSLDNAHRHMSDAVDLSVGQPATAPRSAPQKEAT